MDAPGNISATSPACWLLHILISSEINPCHKAGGKNNPKLGNFSILLNSAPFVSCISALVIYLTLVWTLGCNAATTTGCMNHLLCKRLGFEDGGSLQVMLSTLCGGSFRSAYSTAKEETALPSDTHELAVSMPALVLKTSALCWPERARTAAALHAAGLEAAHAAL